MYLLLVAYASLYPFEGWREHGLSPFAYLWAPVPQYVTAFDVAANVLGYVPYGFLGVAALYPPLARPLALALVLASGAALSLGLEAAQSYLPTRVAASLDVAANIAGLAAGALFAAAFLPRLQASQPLRRLRAIFLPGTVADAGLVLLALWLFTQLNPATLLFAAGDLRDLLAAAPGTARPPQFFVAIEAITAAANLVSVAMLLSALVRPGVRASALLALLVAAALAVKVIAFAIIMRAHDVFAWLTPGAQHGLAVGLLAALAALTLPRVLRLALAAVLLMAATVLVNLAPPNPYLAATLKLWRQGHFLNFNGLTRWVSALWAFAALAYLIYLAAGRRDSAR
ncbi:MAG TPA: VanZ family protein [Burkholderiales bacterium]|nr:VanZ family protein [Burkholderiales bacterium]